MYHTYNTWTDISEIVKCNQYCLKIDGLFHTRHDSVNEYAFFLCVDSLGLPSCPVKR